MERMIANRRMRMIAGHVTAVEVAGKEDEAAAAGHSSSVTRISPLNCRSTLDYVGRRYDNMMLFARQGSISQACFMRQVSVEEDFGHGSQEYASHNISGCKDGEPLFARPENVYLKSSDCKDSEPSFARQENVHLKFSDCKHSEPLFARQENVHLKFSACKDSRPLFVCPAKSDAGDLQSLKKECEFSVVEPPAFAKATTELISAKQPIIMNIGQPVYCDGVKWSPRVDIANSGCDYIVTMELPGMNMNDIRIELDNQSLIVVGKRPIQWWKAANVSVNSYPLYHQRDISQGPYRVVWPLPGDVNKHNVSAEFVDGFLRITLRKF